MIKRVVKKLKQELVEPYQIRHVQGKTKYYCIGRNKTGTTSIKRAFENLCFIVSNQHDAEFLGGRCCFPSNFNPILDLKVLYLAEKVAYQRFMDFIEVPPLLTCPPVRT